MNQDAVLAVRLPHGSYLLAVADGMGGHAAGEVASTEAAAALLRCVRAGSSLARAMVHANTAVFNAGGRVAGRRGMGTTLVAALAGTESFNVVNVGDSRAYLLDPHRATQLTVDHSLVAEATRAGIGAGAVAARWQHAILRAIGTDPSVEVDTFGPYRWQPRSLLLLCSDGLYRAMDDAELHHVVIHSSTVAGAADALVARALALGAEDNVSVALLDAGLIAVEPRVAAADARSRPPALAPRLPATSARRGHGHRLKHRRPRVIAAALGIAALLVLALVLWLVRIT